jgi:hypothetical protein
VATLAVRPMSPRDLPALRHVREHCERLDVPFGFQGVLPELANQVVASLPVDVWRDRIYVASVNNEPCAMAMLRQQEHRYRWDVVLLAAESRRAMRDDQGLVDLWTALLEFGIKEAGSAGAKRLFATAPLDTPAYESLRRAGFEAYSRFTVVAGFLPAAPVAIPAGLRRQDHSDVWSIHQLYHHVTPDTVQFAEALTSSVWEIDDPPLLERIGVRRPQTVAYVLEAGHGIEAYCRIERVQTAPVMSLLRERECQTSAFQFVAAAASVAGLPANALLRVVIPAYSGELVAQFEDEGFYVECERVAMIRHTTSRVPARVRAVPVLVESGERVPQGVPTYYRSVRAAPDAPGVPTQT